VKTFLALAAAAVLASPAAAQSLEALRVSADAALLQALPQAVHPDLAKPQEPILQPALNPRPMRPAEAPGAVVGRASLAAIALNSRHLMTRTFGARALDLGVATDAAFKSYFLTFTAGSATTLAALGDLNRLRGAGVDARIDASTVYNFKVSINIFSPVRGSTLKMTPAQGTRGPQNDVKTGALLDAIRAKSLVFKAHGQELWMFYGADAKPDASGFADTSSFLFIKEDGLSSKAWPLADSKLPHDSSASVDLGGITLNLTRTGAGEIIIRE
jgi:hypothetical protein